MSFRKLATKMKPALHEPIVLFLFFGGVLFVGHNMLRPSGVALEVEITVSDARAANMVQAFIRTWQRPPSQAEFTGLIDDHIRTEVFVREAMALGLDRDDTIIRRRLRQKMEFLTEGELSRLPLNDADLEAYFLEFAEQYRTDTIVSFQHVYLDPAKRGEVLSADAQEMIIQLNDPVTRVSAWELGDKLMMLKPDWHNATYSDVVTLFGGTFSRALLKQQLGVWVGPLSSAYGQHLVKLESVQSGVVPQLSQVRSQVERDWRVTLRREQREALYQRLLKKYHVKRPDLTEYRQH